jgi:hypothetical protein
MKKRRATFLLLWLIVAAMCLMAACNGNPLGDTGEPDDTTDPPAIGAPVASDHAAQFDLDSSGNYTFKLDLKGATTFQLKIGDTALVSEDYIHDKTAKTVSILKITLQSFELGEYEVVITTDGGTAAFGLELIRATEVTFDDDAVAVNTLALADIVKDANFGDLTVQTVRFSNDIIGNKTIDSSYYNYNAETRKFTLKKEYLYKMYDVHWQESSEISITLSNNRVVEFPIRTNLDYYNDYETRVELEQPILFNTGLTDTARLVDGWDGKALSVAGNGGMIFIGSEKTATTGAQGPYGDVRFSPGKNYRMSFEMKKDFSEGLNASTTTFAFYFKDSENFGNATGRTSIRFVKNGPITVDHKSAGGLPSLQSDRIYTTVTEDPVHGFARVVINLAVPAQTAGPDGYLFAAEPGYDANKAPVDVVFAWLFDNFRIEEIPAVETFTVKTPPTTTGYTSGDTFDATGLVLTAGYIGGYSEDLTGGFTLSPTTMTSAAENVVASYLGKTVNIPVTVSLNAIQKTYVYGTPLQLSGDKAVASVYQGAAALVKDRDYTLSGVGDKILTLSKGYLNTINGTATLTVNYAGTDPVIYEVTSALDWSVFSKDFEDMSATASGDFYSAFTNGSGAVTSGISEGNWSGKALYQYGTNANITFGWGNPWQSGDHRGAYGDVRFEPSTTSVVKYQFSFEVKLDTEKNPTGENKLQFNLRKSLNHSSTTSDPVVIQVNAGSAQVVTPQTGIDTTVTFIGDGAYARVTIGFDVASDEELYLHMKAVWKEGSLNYAFIFDNIKVAKMTVAA